MSHLEIELHEPSTVLEASCILLNVHENGKQVKFTR